MEGWAFNDDVHFISFELRLGCLQLYRSDSVFGTTSSPTLTYVLIKWDVMKFKNSLFDGDKYKIIVPFKYSVILNCINNN